MMGGFVSRLLVLALGYAYPAYECYKTVELNKPEIAQLVFWCQYWILVALVTVLERVGDWTISWLPFYGEAKIAFLVYLWYPKTKGTTYIYETFLRPYVAQHENDIDRNLLEFRTRAGDLVVGYWQKAAIVGQSTFFDVLKYVASQSPPQFAKRSTQAEQQQPQDAQETAAPTIPKVKRQASSRARGVSAAVQMFEQAKTSAGVEEPVAASAADRVTVPRSLKPSAPPLPDAEEGAQEDDEQGAANAAGEEDADDAPEETMEEAIKVSATRLRKRAAAATAAAADAPAA